MKCEPGECERCGRWSDDRHSGLLIITGFYREECAECYMGRGPVHVSMDGLTPKARERLSKYRKELEP